MSDVPKMNRPSRGATPPAVSPEVEVVIGKTKDLLDRVARGREHRHDLDGLDDGELQTAISLIDAVSRALWNEASREKRKTR